jgi:hypothetical protein
MLLSSVVVEWVFVKILFWTMRMKNEMPLKKKKNPKLFSAVPY